jgi:hypothetical protein
VPVTSGCQCIAAAGDWSQTTDMPAVISNLLDLFKLPSSILSFRVYPSLFKLATDSDSEALGRATDEQIMT